MLYLLVLEAVKNDFNHFKRTHAIEAFSPFI